MMFLTTSLLFSCTNSQLNIGSGQDNNIVEARAASAAKQLPPDIARAVVSHGYALLIGVDNYSDPRWAKLPSIGKDLDALKETLQPNFKEVKILKNPDTVELRNRLEEFFNKLGNNPEERLFLYYAGHGFTVQNQNTGRSIGFITAKNTPSNESNESAAVEGAVSMSRIDGLAVESQALHILAVFDSCFSGSIFNFRGSSEIPVPADLAGIRHDIAYPVRYYITAGGPDDRIPAESQFANEFIQGILGAADFTGSGYVTDEDLKAYLKRKMPALNNGLAIPQGGKSGRYGGTGEFVFFVPQTERAVGTPSKIRADLPPPRDDAPIDDPSAVPRLDSVDPATIKNVSVVDGGLYIGQLSNNSQFEGVGRLHFQNNDVYNGSFHSGIFSGLGNMQWHDGSRYIGYWKNGEEDGQGTYYYTDHSRYQGEWRLGAREGHGTLSDPNGFSYKGSWVNDDWEGHGVATTSDGRTIEGEWLGGAGVGPATYNDGKADYPGVWKGNRLMAGTKVLIQMVRSQ